MSRSSDFFHEFNGPNAAYILDQYERFLADPFNVDPAWLAIFKDWHPPDENEASPTKTELQPSPALLNQAVAVANLAQAIRSYGHLAAHLDPLGSPPPGDASLDPASYGLSAVDLSSLPVSLVTSVAHSQYGPAGSRLNLEEKKGSPSSNIPLSPAPSSPEATAYDAIQSLMRIYTGDIGYD